MQSDLALAHAKWMGQVDTESTWQEADEALALALYQEGVIGKADVVQEVIHVKNTLCIAMESGRMLELNPEGEITHDSHQRRTAS